MMKVERASLSKSKLVDSPGKEPWHNVVSTMGFEMNGIILLKVLLRWGSCNGRRCCICGSGDWGF